MKSMLTARGDDRLKLKYDHLLSSFAFSFNVRRYNVGGTQDMLLLHLINRQSVRDLEARTGR